MASDATEEYAAKPLIDWYLVGLDCTGGMLYVLGLLAVLVGACLPAIALWAASVWLDRRTLAHLRAVHSGVGPAQLGAYLNFRVTRMGIAQILAAVAGLGLAVGGQLAAALGIWAVVAAGATATRSFAALITPGA